MTIQKKRVEIKGIKDEKLFVITQSIVILKKKSFVK